MGRPKSKDNRSLNLIILTLSQAQEGLWIMEISRRSKLNPNTVAYHVRQHPELFDEQSIEGPKKAFFTLIKLKPGVTTKPGTLLAKIMKEHEGR
jgi:hypothetical protein